MIKYKWCVCDMDGTLLNSKGIISQENEKALKYLASKGLEVIIASGRVDLMVKSYIKQLSLRGYIIACNGGLIRNIGTGEIIYSKIMDKDTSKEIIFYCIQNNIDFLIYTTDLVYSNKNNPRAENYEDINKNLAKDLHIPIKYLDDAIIKNIYSIDVLKILLICEDQKEVKALEDKFSKIHDLTVVSSFNGLLDIMAPNVSKGNALKILSKKLDMDLSKVIAFGDNNNDLEMFQCVGMPIAMENAIDKIKLHAKHITKSNDESGVAYAINNLIL